MSQTAVPKPSIPQAMFKKFEASATNLGSYGSNPALYTQLTLGAWIDREHADEVHDPRSINTLYLQAITFLERHLRERLQIADGEDVVIGFDPERTRPRQSQNESHGWARHEEAHGLPNSIALRDLYPEFKGSGSMKTILLYEDPVRKVDDGWSSVATITVEYIRDRWCVTSVLVWGGADTAQARAADLFLPKSRLAEVDLHELPAYKNALDVDYPAPIRNKSEQL